MKLLNHRGSIAVNTTVVHHMRMSREDPQFKLRLPPELKARIDQAATENHRSINAEIVARLEQSFPHEGPADPAVDKALALSGETQPSEAAKIWAERIAAPGHRAELEALLTTVLKMMSVAKE